VTHVSLGVILTHWIFLYLAACVCSGLPGMIASGVFREPRIDTKLAACVACVCMHLHKPFGLLTYV